MPENRSDRTTLQMRTDWKQGDPRERSGVSEGGLGAAKGQMQPRPDN